jgi:hypothetical protein
METAAKLLIAAGLLLLVAGVVALLFARLGIHRLPGDIVVRGRRVTLYLPLGLMLVLSLVLTILLNLLSRK